MSIVFGLSLVIPVMRIETGWMTGVANAINPEAPAANTVAVPAPQSNSLLERAGSLLLHLHS